MGAIEVLKENKTFAVIGLSDNPEKYSYKIYKCLKSMDKEVYGVSNRLEILEGQKVYASLKDIPTQIEVAVFVVAPRFGYQYIEECKKLNIPYLWLQPGTYDDDFLSKLQGNKQTYYLDCVLRKAQELE